ncbi:MAG: hypothetical protein C0418_00790 [Coriobacteriaceae bacterium]|nr:hypothetical protein [Coriobacteriaceae bacterium]
MARRVHRPMAGLAGNLTLLALAIVGGALVLVGAAALGGVYDFARREVDARLVDYSRLVAGEVEGRFSAAGAVVRDVADTVVRGDGRVDAAALAVAYGRNQQRFERLYVLDASGALEAAYPPVKGIFAPAGLPAVADADGSPRFAVRSGEGTAAPTVWVYVSTEVTGHVLVGRLKTDAVAVLLDQVAGARQGRVAVVLETGGPMLLRGAGREVVPGRMVFEPFDADDASAGRVSIWDTRYGTQAGAYSDVRGLSGLDWRVVVAEPHAMVLRDVWAALMPAAVVMFVLSVLLVVLTYVTASLLVRPLRDLEARAHKAQAGAYVRPLAVRRQDEVGRLAEAFNALILRLNALHDVAELMAGAAHIEQVLDAIVSALRHIAPSARSAVYLVEPSRSRLVLARSSGSSMEAEKELPLTRHSWIEDVLGGVGPACPTALARAGGGEAAALAEVGPGSGFAVPLAAGSEAIGVIVLFQPVRALSDAEMDMVRVFAAQAAVAIRTSRLFEMEHLSRREAEVLRAVAEQLSNPADLAEAMHIVGALAGALLGTAQSGVSLREDCAPGVDVTAATSDRGWLELWDALAAGGSADPERSVVMEDVAAVPEASAWALGRDVASMMLVPLLRGREACGVLAFEWGSPGVQMDEHRVALARTIGRQMGLALENAALFEEARSRATNLETIFRVSQTVSSALQSKVVLNRVLDVVQKIFSADAVALMTYDPARRVIATAMARGLLSQEMLYFETVPGEDLPGQVFEERVPVAEGELGSREDRLSRLALSQGLHSLLAVPLMARGRSIGVLSAYSREREAFEPEDVELLMTFAAQAALAIDTANLFAREHAVASVLQSSLVPARVPSPEGLDIASEYRVGSPDAEIGGDYYDVFRTPDGRWALVIGDVCGKGVEAATKTSMIKYATRGLVAAGAGPAEALALLNDMVCESGDASDIVTVWLGMLDADAGRLTYGNGGHPPALLMDPASKRITRLSTTGPILGAIAGVPFDEREVRVPKGASLLLYTDGVTEARKGNRFFGEGRVRRALREGGTADQTATRLLEALEEFAALGLRDDVAVLVVRLVDSRA